MCTSVETLWIKEKDINKAVELLKNKEVVAFPTETVYGLGADATDDQAVKKIYQAKGRPSDNPLIVHIHDMDQVYEFTDTISLKAKQLMEAFWPGPLTVILDHTKDKACKTVTAGLNSIGLRMPSHPLALKLLKESGLTLAAPSANLSGKPSPTSADHVWHDLKGKVAGVVDGGQTGVGLESTVIDLTDDSQPTILRPGGLTIEYIESVIGHVAVNSDFEASAEGPKAPGMKYRHYSPDKPVYIVADSWQEAVEKNLKSGEKIGILASDDIINQFADQAEAVFSLGQSKDVKSASQMLYKGLRYFDQSQVTVILAQAYAKEDLGLAYMNRLEKAAGSH